LFNAIAVERPKEEKIFVFGGDINLKFIQYVADLTGKENPVLCYFPTASADNSENIKYYNSICEKIGIEPHVMKVWVSSSGTNRSFENIIMNSDAIVVGGGNTLNMLGIWKYQGIDTILRKALKKGIIMAGGSAGSICWFENGISDSRPSALSLVKGLGLLPYSNCPHYSEIERKNLYHKMISNGECNAGFACDAGAGILFKNGRAVDFVTISDLSGTWFVKNRKGKIYEKKMHSQFLLKHDALSEKDLTYRNVGKKIKSIMLYPEGNTSPEKAYAAAIKKFRLGRQNISEKEYNSVMNISVEKVFVYDNKIAGVVNDAYKTSFGYGLWYFYNREGKWVSVGEDIGGKTLKESEITFREKAVLMLNKAEKE
jgi:peptidase E